MSRLYSLFEKRGWRYHRVSQMAFSLAVARHVFQDDLLTGSKSLRVVSDGWNSKTNRYIYNPPVEQLEPPKGAYEQLADKNTTATMRQLNGKHYTVPQARTYRSGGDK